MMQSNSSDFDPEYPKGTSKGTSLNQTNQSKSKKGWKNKSSKYDEDPSESWDND